MLVLRVVLLCVACVLHVSCMAGPRNTPILLMLCHFAYVLLPQICHWPAQAPAVECPRGASLALSGCCLPSIDSFAPCLWPARAPAMECTSCVFGSV